MLNQNPIFLGGQGGMVGACRLGYGITVAAGTIVRKDETRSDRLIMGGAGKGGNVALTPGTFRSDKRFRWQSSSMQANSRAGINPSPYLFGETSLVVAGFIPACKGSLRRALRL